MLAAKPKEPPLPLAPDLKDQTPLPLKEQVAKVFCACP
jgi:hypothetical protein